MFLDVVAAARYIQAAERHEVEALYATLSDLRTRCQMRLMGHAPRVSDATEPMRVSPQTAAQLLDLRNEKGEISPKWLYKHWHEIPGAQKISPRKLSFDLARLRKHFSER